MRLQRLANKYRRSGAFTLVELMIVVVIVAVLALVAIPLYQSNVTAAKMSEGIAGVGTIRTAMRVYAASNAGSYAGVVGLSDVNISASDLEGKYFDGTSYAISNVTATTYTITATMGTNTYIIDQDGVESGTFTTGN